jgi:hypothetical protein
MKFQALSALSPDSKLWVFQCSRQIGQGELATIEKSIREFINSWTAHGAALNAAFEIKYNRFIIIVVDEQNATASGCSIDKLTKFIKDLGALLDVDFLDRMQVAYRNSDNDIQACSLREFEALAQSKIVNESTIVFNNMVTSKRMFDNEWEVPLINSWHNRVLR